MSLEVLLERANELASALDPIVEGITDLPSQSQADWAWYRLGSILVMVRDRGAGAASASLARGLLEQAAYWDWAAATGIDAEHLNRWAALEYRRLRAMADEIAGDDHLWLDWILPPGVNLVAEAGPAVPRNAGDAVKRLGLGLQEAALEPLQFRGLFAANRLLDVLTHGNVAAALVLEPGEGQELPEALAAAVVHVAAAGAAAVVLAHAAEPASGDDAIRLASEVARAASAVHRLPLGVPTLSQRPARGHHGTAFDAHSDISRMPPAQPSMTDAARRFLASATELVVAADQLAPIGDLNSWIPWASFRMSWGQMQVVQGVVTGQLGRALLPTAARALFEDGARWEWLRRRAITNPSGDSLRALVADSKRHIMRIRLGLISDGVPSEVVDDLLGDAKELLAANPGDGELPPIRELLTAAYPTADGVNTALPIYSILSQFVHSTPLAVLHLRRDNFPSLTAPTYAVAVEAACRGFAHTANATLPLSAVTGATINANIRLLASSLNDVVIEARRWHFLG